MISFCIDFVKKHFLIILCCAIFAYIWPNIQTINHKSNEIQTESNEEINVRLFTLNELSKFDGVQEKQLYLSILGKVYDVSKGERHYKAGETYHYFLGKDASVSFITGDFKENDKLNDDVIKHLSAQDIHSIVQWQQFYDKQYEFVGLLIGRFYDSNGSRTNYMMDVERLVELAIEKKKQTEEIKRKYPDCNVEFKQETGTRVWCSTQSGGIDRDWIGFPRKSYKNDKKDEYRCVCVNSDNIDDEHLKKYDNCEENAIECHYRI